MNVKKVRQELRKQYPTATEILDPSDKPTAVYMRMPIGNVASVMNGVVDEIPVHYHKRSAEIYYVVEGTLTLFVNGDTYTLGQGDYHIIQPGETHWGQGRETIVEIYSEPALSPSDIFYGEPQATLAFPRHMRIVSNDIAQTTDQLTSLFRCTIAQSGTEKLKFNCADAIVSVVARNALPKELSYINGYMIIHHSDIDEAIAEAQKKGMTLLYRQAALAFLTDESHNIFEIHEREE